MIQAVRCGPASRDRPSTTAVKNISACGCEEEKLWSEDTGFYLIQRVFEQSSGKVCGQDTGGISRKCVLLVRDHYIRAASLFIITRDNIVISTYGSPFETYHLRDLIRAVPEVQL